MNEEVTLKNREAHEAAEKLATYEWGFTSDIESERAPKGLNEDTVRYISAKKGEPEWLLDWRLKAFRAWLEMEEVDWANLSIPAIDYQDAYYYAEPKKKPTIASLDELDPEIRRTYEKLGIPIEEQKVLAGVEGARKVAVDAVFDSVSVATTFREELAKAGVIFLSISEAVRSIRSSSANISAASFRSATTSSPASTARSFPTAPSSTSPRASAARWSCRPISASMPRTPVSSSGR
jgi:Fe-S cluster assembly protein SufB